MERRARRNMFTGLKTCVGSGDDHQANCSEIAELVRIKMPFICLNIPIVRYHND
jgi:hypothetical protein